MTGMLKTVAPKAAPQGKITEQSIRAQLHLNGKQGDQLDRIVLAGKKILFDAKTHELMLQQLDGPGTMAEKLGKGVAGLMGLLMGESKNSLPPNLLIPAGLILVAVAADFLKQSGEQIADQDIGNAMDVMTTAILQAGGVDPSKLPDGAAAKPASAGQSAPIKQGEMQ